MSRLARYENKTITNTYHILLRGINKQDIFLDKNDKDKFWKSIKNAKEKYKFKIYAVVLMSNHVHLTIYDPEDKMSQIIHQICTSYAMYFNIKYERVGHVFQNRFKNICVDTEKYLLNLIRYIHKNPQKDGICEMEDYAWSSYSDYVSNNNEVIDIDFILELFDEDRKNAIYRFVNYHLTGKQEYLDKEFEFDNTVTDDEVCKLIKKELKIDNILLIQNYSTKIRNEIICRISKKYRIQPKQMSRILGMGERNIQRIIKEDKDIVVV